MSEVNKRIARRYFEEMLNGDVDVAEIGEFATDHPEITAHQVTPLLGIDGAQLFFDGTSQSSSVQQNSLMVPEGERDRANGMVGTANGIAFLAASIGQMFTGAEATETLQLAALACEVGDDAPQSPACSVVLRLRP